MNGWADAVRGTGAVGAALGTAVYLCLALAGWRQERGVRRRGGRLTGMDADGPTPGGSCRRVTGPGGLRLWAGPVGAFVTGWVLVGGVPGCGVGLTAAYGVWRWSRSGRGSSDGGRKAEAAAVARQLPLAADLLAACISAGAGPLDAAEAVGESMGGQVGELLARTAAEIRLGGQPADAWGRFGEIPGAGPLARCLDRAGSTGAPAAEPVARLADEMRAERAAAAVARAQRAGVLITAPVGLCFLPAFLAVGVAPVVIGLATGLLHRT
ncbi:type II secretion system F family protein [Streptomyces griseus]|uniref:type II secretion system F family protein n=1 Tax=Streptomyces griseus TaxID=1911 RepID=UPI0008408B94|nr:type II secretion system F family protein [Streptomyces griseus]